MNFNKKLLRQIDLALAKRKQIEQEGKRGKEPNLKEISDALDEYYFYQKLRVYCAYLSYQLIINPQKIPYTENDLRLIPTITSEVTSSLPMSIGITIYNSIKSLYQCTGNDTKESIHSLEKTQQFIDEHIRQFSKSEGIEMYSFLTNYCTWVINHSSTSEDKKNYFAQRHLIAASSILRLEIEDKTKKIPAQLYRNIVTLAINIKDDSFYQSPELYKFEDSLDQNKQWDRWAWIDQLMQYFKKGLSEKEANLYYSYCKALVEFEKSQFKNAYITLKQSLHKKELFTTLSIRILYLKVLLELELAAPEFLDQEEVTPGNEAENYRNLIKYEKGKRQKMNYHLDYFITFNKFYLKFIRLYNRLYGNNKPEEKDLEEKTDFVNELKIVSHSYKSWFLKKLEEIE